jgi:hypothetical protein
MMYMASGYYQIMLDMADHHKTAVITLYGPFKHSCIGFAKTWTTVESLEFVVAELS